MPLHTFKPIAGRIESFFIESENLAANLLGDPSEREVCVYLPSGHDVGAPLPVLVDLVGFTGSGKAHLNWKPFGESVPQRHERLVEEDKMGPCIIVFPDCFTSLGGNQYIDSVALGRWATYLTDEMLPELDNRFNTIASSIGRGVFGKSSGGYGALYHGMRHSDAWGAAASHSGDVGFDRLFLGEFPKTLDMLAKHGGISEFISQLESSQKLEGDMFHVLMMLAMGASYDPDPNACKGIRLPVDLKDCNLDAQRWQAWMDYDPLTMLEQQSSQSSLHSLLGLYIDCGSRDQYAIHYGTRSFTNRLKELEIPHHYEEFDDTHSSIDYRMDESLPFLYHALMG